MVPNTCYEMAPVKLENCAQCCFKKFDCRLFISKFIEIGFYLSLSLSVISKSLAQPFSAVAASQRCVECAIHRELDVHDEQHPCGANKQK